MACYHKFYNDLHANDVDYEPNTLIVGTFSPAWPTTNIAEWFYGRTEDNFFWDILPRLYGETSLLHSNAPDWRAFCARRGIILTDLIGCIQDADPHLPNHQRMLGGFTDEAIIHNFSNFEFINVTTILQKYATIRNVYLTRPIREVFWRHLWNPVMYYANRNNIYERQLLTPSLNSKYHQQVYNRSHTEAPELSLPDYLLMRWQEVWHNIDP